MKNDNCFILIIILLHHLISCSCFVFHDRKTSIAIKSNNNRKGQLLRESKKFLSCKLHLQKSSSNLKDEEKIRVTTTTTSKEKKQIIPSKRWDYMYSVLKDFHQREGHCNVLREYITEDGEKLGIWLKTQRHNRRKGKLNEVQEQKFNEMSIIWNPTESWEYMYSLLLEFQKLEGNCNIPQNYITPDGKKLGVWLKNQRFKRRKGKLNEEQIKGLDKIGITWDLISTKSWECMYSTLSEIYDEEGNCNVPKSYSTEDGKNLGTWLIRQRVNRRIGKLSKEREQKLEQIGIMWDFVRLESWESMYSFLLEFQQREGHCKIPLDYITEDGKNLGMWLKNQRCFRRKGTLKKEQEKKLDGIGIVWDPYSTESWEGIYSVLLEYQQQEGNCNVPQKYTTRDGKKLGVWLSNQRASRRRGKLNEEREQKLNELGIIWNPPKRRNLPNKKEKDVCG